LDTVTAAGSRSGRPALVYISALAILSTALLFVAPAALVVLALLALAAVVFIWIKAGLRTGRWFWLRSASALTGPEAAAWTSSLVVLGFGVVAVFYVGMLVGRSGVPLPLLLGAGSSSASTRASTFSDPETQERFKRELEAGKVPHSTYSRDGKEWISWDAKDDAVVEELRAKAQAGPLTSGRNVAFGDSTQEEEFVNWLTKRGVPHTRVSSHGKTFVVWEGDETSEKLMDAFHRDQQARLQALSDEECRRQAAKKRDNKGRKPC
jgi:hypothetical protein